MDPKEQKNWDYIIKHITSNGGLYPKYPYDVITTVVDDEWNAAIESEEAWQSKPVLDRKAKQFEEFAKAAMHELSEHGLADFVLLKNDKLRTWWQSVLKEELAAQTKRDAIERKKKLKEQALGKLSDEEKEALGLNKKGKA